MSKEITGRKKIFIYLELSKMSSSNGFFEIIILVDMSFIIC